MTSSIAILGCGWLGLPLGQVLAEAGHRVAGSTTTPDKLATLTDAGIAPHLLRLGPDTSPAALAPLLADANVLILNVPPSRSAPTDRRDYTAALAPIAAALPASPVRHVVFVSSTGVYPNESRIMRESDAVAGPDAESPLLQAEWLFQQPAQSWQTTVLRFGGLMGPGRSPGRFLAGRSDVPEPDVPVNMLHLVDAIGVIQSVIEQNAWGHTLNVCADSHPTRREFYTLAAECLSLPHPHFLPENHRGGKLISTEQLHATLRYEFVHPDPVAALTHCP